MGTLDGLAAVLHAATDLRSRLLGGAGAGPAPQPLAPKAIDWVSDNFHEIQPDPNATPDMVRRVVNYELRALKARQSSENEQRSTVVAPNDESGTAVRALSVTTSARAGGADQEAAQLIARRLGDELPRLIELLGNSDVSTLARHLKQLTSR